MKIGIIGSGNVGQQLAAGFAKSGDHVKIGTRDTSKLDEWKKNMGENVHVGSFKEAAKFGEVIVLATKWTGTKDAIKLAGKRYFKGKIVIDVTNPLLFEKENEAPKLSLNYPKSGGWQVQKWLKDSKVVKAFNSMTASYMANPNLNEGKADLFMAGNDNEAKGKVKEIAGKWGWDPIDVGDINQAYLLENLALLWIRYGFMNNHWTHAFKLLKK